MTYRPDLAQHPHTITIEPITPELRGDTSLPEAATLVVVERHHGRLAKVTGSTDAEVADFVSEGYDVTIEAVARAIANLYGATYVPPTVVRTVSAQNGMPGYQVHALRAGAPLPDGKRIARVKDYGSDTTLIVVDSGGSEHYLHRHTEIRVLDSGVVRLVEPEHTGWAGD